LGKELTLSLIQQQHMELLWRIGNISVRFASIEQHVVDSVCLCLGGHDLSSGLVVTDKLSYSATLALLEELFRKKLPAMYLRRMEILIPKLKSASTIRNETLHATVIMLNSEHSEFILEAIRYRKGKKNSDRKLSLNDFDKYIKELNNTDNDISKLNSELLGHFTSNATPIR